MTKGEPIPARGSLPAGAAAGEDEGSWEGISLAHVTEALTLITQAAVDFRTYPAGHPRLRRSLEACTERLNGLVQTRTSLIIAVSREGFLVGRTPLGRRSPRARSLALEFYRRRIARFGIRRGVHPTELQHFLEVLRLNPRAVDGSGGAERILIERGVQHISVQEAVFLFPPGDTGGVLDDPGRPLPVAEERRRPAKKEERKPQVAVLEKSRDLLARLDELLQEADQLITPEAYHAVAEQLERLGALAIERGLMPVFLKILKAFLAHENVAGHKPIAIQDRARTGLVRLTAAGGPQLLIERLCERGEPYREEILGALAAIGHPAIKPLVDRLSFEEATYPRRIIMEALAWHGSGAIPYLEAALLDALPSLAWRLVVVAGEIGGPSAIALIRRALQFPEFQVRVEAVKSLGRIGSPEAIAVLLSLLKDRRELIRVAAISALGRARDETAVGPLLALLRRRSGWTRQQLIREAAIGALGMIGAEEAIGLLGKLLRRRGFSTHRVFNKLRGPVALALASVGTDEAVAVLEAGARSPHRGIRRAAAGALRRVKRGLWWVEEH